jgi:PmbA protein
MNAAAEATGDDMARGREIVERALTQARRAGAEAADAVLIEANSHQARVRDREIDFVKQAQERCLGIRALVQRAGGMSSAVTSTSDLAEATVDRMAHETVALARAIAPDPTAGLPEGGFASELPELDLFDPRDRSVSVEARIEDARLAERAARELDPRIVNSEGSQVESDFAGVVYGNTAGFLGHYQSATHWLFSEPLASEGDSMQRDYWMTVGRRLDLLEDPASVGRRAAQRALRRLGARPVKTCEVPVIFDGVTARSLLGHVESLVSGYSVYRQASAWADRLGERVAADGVTVIDDGRLPGGLGSKPFDGEGLPTRRSAVIEDGRLASWLLDSYSARKLGMSSTGNASRGAGSSPGVGSTNLWIEPGDKTLDDIIADTERGLLVTELIGMGFNPVTGDYSRGAVGLWIESGEITHPVEEVTIAGNLTDMLCGIDSVGCELMWLGSTASPPLRIQCMTLAGE